MQWNFLLNDSSFAQIRTELPPVSTQPTTPPESCPTSLSFRFFDARCTTAAPNSYFSLPFDSSFLCIARGKDFVLSARISIFSWLAYQPARQIHSSMERRNVPSRSKILPRCLVNFDGCFEFHSRAGCSERFSSRLVSWYAWILCNRKIACPWIVEEGTMLSQWGSLKIECNVRIGILSMKMFAT